MQVTGSGVVVTGGASGLGAGTARMVVDGGGRVVLFDRPSSHGADVATELGPAARFVPVDVTDTEQVERAVADAVAFLGRVDVLVGCAGISPAARVVSSKGALFPLEKYRTAIDVNLVGAFDVIRQVAGVMAAAEPGEDGERGLIVNVGSIAAYEGQVGQAAYSASKGGIVAMTLPLARDLGPWGIRVVTVCPGTFDTPMVRAVAGDLVDSLARTNVFPTRLGRPSDFAAVVRSAMEVVYLNGEVIRVDAGARLAAR